MAAEQRKLGGVLHLDQLTVCLVPGDLGAPRHTELSVLTGEGDAKGERGVGDVVIEVVLLPDCNSLHVVHVHFYCQSVHALLLVHHLLPHLLKKL